MLKSAISPFVIALNSHWAASRGPLHKKIEDGFPPSITYAAVLRRPKLTNRIYPN